MAANNTSSSSKLTDWMIFLVSTIATIAMLMYLPAWFWIGLPFALTYLVRALDVM